MITTYILIDHATTDDCESSNNDTENATSPEPVGVEEALPTSRQPLEMELAPPKPRGTARPQRDSVLPGGFLVSSEGTLKENRISVDERAINEATVRDRVYSLTRSLTHSLTHSLLVYSLCVCVCVCVFSFFSPCTLHQQHH